MNEQGSLGQDAAPEQEGLAPGPDAAVLGPGDYQVAHPRLSGRLGLDIPLGWWPTRPQAKAHEAAGLAWMQVPSPPEPVLAGTRLRERHAEELAAQLDISHPRVVVHAPLELRVGGSAPDHAFEGLLRYASQVGAEMLVYHGLAFSPTAEHDRIRAEERSLRRLVRLAERLEVTVAIENLAPVHLGTEFVERACQSPKAVQELARRLESERAGVCFDIGHAHIVGEFAGISLADLLDPVIESVVLFHAHDNLGARRRAHRRPTLDPLRLDLHLPPGAGTVPWSEVGARVRDHSAPVLLEIHPPHRSEPLDLARSLSGALASRAVRP